MIQVRGTLRTRFGGGLARVDWTGGQVIGDQAALDALAVLAERHRNLPVIPTGGDPVADWRTSSIGFGMLVLEAFEPDVRIISSGEPLAPPPCPEGAFC